MKILNLIVCTSASFSLTFSQTETPTDEKLFYSLIGTWEHVSSTYPGGDVVTYQRSIQFLADGTGICTKFQQEDTLAISFQWEVKESVVHLFVLTRFGKRINADAQHVSLVNFNKMYLTDAYGEDQTGKVCCYYRAGLNTVKY